jgi:twitching motility two-component system response regulator PilG
MEAERLPFEEASFIESKTLLLRGITAARAGDRTSARACLLEASSQEPGREATWLWRALVAESPTEARECLERALDLNAGNEETRNSLWEALVREGVAFAQGGDREGAARVLSRVTEGDPQNELAWHWRAFVADSDEERVHCMERVLAINPSNERAKAWFARLSLPVSRPAEKIGDGTGKEEEACPICERAMEPSSEGCSSCGSVVSWKNPTALLSGAAADLRTVRAAIHRLVRIEGGEKDAVVQAHLAIAHLNLAQFPQALKRLQAAKALGLQTPGFAEILTQVKRKIDEVAASTGPLPPVVAPDRDSLRARATAAPVSRRGTILTVDDSATVRKLVTVTLVRKGFRVLAAAGGTDALAILDETVPDLVFLDITMPNMDGYQLCKAIRAVDRLKALPIIMLSGKDGMFDEVRGRLVGATASLAKPFEPSTLVETAERHLLEARRGG